MSCIPNSYFQFIILLECVVFAMSFLNIPSIYEISLETGISPLLKNFSGGAITLRLINLTAFLFEYALIAREPDLCQKLGLALSHLL